MRKFYLGFFVLIKFAGLSLAIDARQADENWITNFRRYARQENIQTESRYSAKKANGETLLFSDVLRQLPSPEEWARLGKALHEAEAKAPEGKERGRLQAGGWLLKYLAGDRKALLSELKATSSAASEKEQHMMYGIRNLLESLESAENSTESVEKQAKAFEDQLAMFEPVDEIAVKQALGGEENFARLKRVLAAQREMSAQAMEIFEQYEKDKDEAAAQTKLEKLQNSNDPKIKADQEALEPYTNDGLVRQYIQTLFSHGGDSENYIPTLFVPDLLAAFGAERATALLHRAFRTPAKLEMSGELSKPMRELLRKLFVADLALVKAPCWGLVRDTDSAELFEALQKKFPDAEKDYSYRTACGYYLVSLISQARTDEAVKFVTSLKAGSEESDKVYLPYDVTGELERIHPVEFWEFLHGWLVVQPSVGEWDRFNRLSVLLDRRDELKQLIKKMAESGAFEGMERLAVQRMQADAELATGEIVAAVRRLNDLVKTPANDKSERSEQEKIAKRLLSLADLQKDEASFAQALKIAENLVAKNLSDDAEKAGASAENLIATLNGLERFDQAARLGQKELVRMSEVEKKPSTQKEDEVDPLLSLKSSFQAIVGQQLRAYVQLERWSEAQALLRENQWWGAGDLAELLIRNVECQGKPLGYYAACVAQGQGDAALAERIAEAQLLVTPAVDAVYELYVGLAGQRALPLLQKLAASDRYEERPLIWQAKLLMNQKRWDEAAAVLQEAITIDPSDGEQGRGDRMRVYAFMSTVMAGKGDAEKAGFFSNVVKAIRMSETADRWYEIGAYSQAISLYREALGFFQDAYCIQSRMAIRLADAGKMDEAAEHYRRAFELMPDSFGRVESHCFGCEHVFAGEKSKSVAEEVFARMLKARPDKPQLHYLSGYLREEQERFAEAAEFYRHAVSLDPLYLNAWNRLAGLEDKLKFTPEQRDDLFLKLLELDPRQKHASGDLVKVTDLPRLWRALRENQKLIDTLPRPKKLGELKGSAARASTNHDVFSWTAEGTKDFCDVLLEHSFVQALQTHLSILSQAEMGEVAH